MVIIKAEDRVKLLPAAGVRAFIHWNSRLATIDPEGRREVGELPYKFITLICKLLTSQPRYSLLATYPLVDGYSMISFNRPLSRF